MNYEDLKKIVIGISSPRELNFGRDKAAIDSLPVKEHVLLFVRESSEDLATRALMDEVARISEKYHGRLLFVSIDENQFSVLQFFNLKPSDLPQAILVDMRNELSLIKYIMIPDFLDDIDESVNQQKPDKIQQLLPRYHIYESRLDSTDSQTTNGMYKALQPGLLERFLDSYLNGMLRKSLFSESEDVSKLQTTPSTGGSETSRVHGEVQSLVGKNFNAHLSSIPDVDVLAFFYAPWCTFCKSAEPIFYEIAGLLGNASETYSSRSMNESASDLEAFNYLSVVQIDATRNEVDHPSLKIRGFPSIQLFRRGDSLSPVEYEGEYTTSELLVFLSTYRIPIGLESQNYDSTIGISEVSGEKELGSSGKEL